MGVVHINLPNALSIHNLVALSMGLIHNPFALSERAIRMNRKRAYDVKVLQELVHEAGFQVLDKETFFLKPLTYSQVAIALQVGALNTSVLDGFYQASRYFPANGAEICMNLKRQ